MSDVVIRAEGLGKKYIIGHQAERERYTTLRDSVGRSLKNWGRSARDMFAGKALVAGDKTEEFWALKDINFEIKRGDVVGIIGRNGAGKSTLLKVLSRITEPTTGRVTIDGRVASLLEVGTGFHPELSGRENIYLNGAILGMSREEIRRKFDEIVDFAGVEKFLDTPVKRYSSGMYVRLAFAVAAHLEPEILIVDEVLAVGDAEFQKKCLGKMKDVAGHGRTVLFVSHNMGAIASLCNSGIILSKGSIAIVSTVEDVLQFYSNRVLNNRLSNFNGNSAQLQSCNIILENPQHIHMKISDVRLPEGIYEVRALITSSIGVSTGIASVGGFGSSGIHLSPLNTNFTINIFLPILASDNYLVTLEWVNNDTGLVILRIEMDDMEFRQSPLPNETVVLNGSWGFGPIRFPMIIT